MTDERTDDIDGAEGFEGPDGSMAASAGSYDGETVEEVEVPAEATPEDGWTAVDDEVPGGWVEPQEDLESVESVADVEPVEAREVVEPVRAARPAPAPAADVDSDLLVAHVLLRMGSPLPARAHLETLAGTDRLDRQALLDLAESRWRTGDLRGAGEATVAYFEQGGGAALAYLIAAEATAATGRPGEASRYARRSLDRLNIPLDAVFAGQPRSSIWPIDPSDPGQHVATLFAEPATAPSRGGRIGLTSPARSTGTTPAAEGTSTPSGVPVMAEPGDAEPSPMTFEVVPERSLWDEPDAAHEAAPERAPEPAAGPASVRAPVELPGPGSAQPDAAFELDGARDDLAAGDQRAAAVRLSVVLRTRPALAPAVLDLIGDLPGPDFDLLRGDALRLVGREAAAQRAFASAASALTESPETRSTK